MKALLSAALAAATLAVVVGATPAAAGCHACYRPPVQYRQVIAPPQYGVVERTVLVAPARVIYRRVAAEYGTVQQTVVVAPERIGWQPVCDACGRVGYRKYVVPAQYGTVERTVVVTPARVVAETIPAQYATVAQTVLVAPARSYLVRVNGCNTCGY